MQRIYTKKIGPNEYEITPVIEFRYVNGKKILFQLHIEKGTNRKEWLQVESDELEETK